MRKNFLVLSLAGVLGAAAYAGPSEVDATYDCHHDIMGPIFEDVCHGTTHSSEIREMRDRGILTGYSDGNFHPNETIIRGQVATLMTRAFDIPVPDTVSEDLYPDVSASHHYAPVVKAVTDAGIMTGREGNSVFDTGVTLHRQQMASILMRVLDMNDVERAEGNGVEVTDLDDALAVHQDNIQALQAHGITQTTDGTFRPMEPVSRSQMATFIERTLAVLYTDELGLESMEMVDPYTFNIHFYRDIRDEEWNADNFRLRGSTEHLEVIDDQTLQIRTDYRLNYGQALVLYYKDQRTTLSYERERSDIRNVNVDINGARIDVSGEFPVDFDDSGFYIVLEGPDGFEESAEKGAGLQMDGHRFKASFSRLVPGDYILLLDSGNYGREEFEITIEEFDPTFSRVDATTDTIRKEVGQTLQFDVDGLELSVDELAAEGFELIFNLTDGYELTDSSGGFDASELAHRETFSYTVAIRDEEGTEITSDSQEVLVIDPNVPVHISPLFELDGNFMSRFVRLDHTGAQLVFRGQNYFYESVPTEVFESITIKEVTSSHPESAEYDLEEGLIVHETGDTEHVTFDISFEEIEETASITLPVYGYTPDN